MSTEVAPGGRPEADRERLVLRPGPSGALPDVVDVLLQGRRTVSFSLDRSEPGPVEGTRCLRWPSALQSVLRGSATLRIRDAVTGAVTDPVEVRFTDDPEPLDLTSASGRWMSVNKWGRLAASFDGMEPAPRRAVQDLLLADARQLADDLTDLGLTPFVVYGTLLGIRRDGDLIPHDDDADLAYLAASSDPVDVVRESYRISGALVAAGHDVVRHSGGHLQVRFGAGEEARYVDIFTAFRIGGTTYLCFQVGAPGLDLDELTAVELRGHEFLSPVQADDLLEATYGSGWRRPDPSFTFTTPEPVRARLQSWMGEFNVVRDYWQDFYSSTDTARVPMGESDFARWVSDRLPAQVPVLDVGTGTARDARFFAHQGRRVRGIDYSHAAVRSAQERSSEQGWGASFDVVNLSDLHAVGQVVRDLDMSRGWHLYARFLIHALDDPTRRNLWVLTKEVVRAGGRAWFEFRTAEDQAQPHVFGEHFRRYLDPADVVVEVQEAGMDVVELEQGRGLARFRDEDPHVARMVVGVR